MSKIIAHLKGWRDLGIVFEQGGHLTVALYEDANNADKAYDRLSVLGAVVMTGKTVVSASGITQHY